MRSSRRRERGEGYPPLHSDSCCDPHGWSSSVWVRLDPPCLVVFVARRGRGRGKDHGNLHALEPGQVRFQGGGASPKRRGRTWRIHRWRQKRPLSRMGARIAPHRPSFGSVAGGAGRGGAADSSPPPTGCGPRHERCSCCCCCRDQVVWRGGSYWIGSTISGVVVRRTNPLPRMDTEGSMGSIRWKKGCW